MTVDANALAQLQTRSGVHARWLIWVQAKNRSTGAQETMGLWTGEDRQQFSVDGQLRIYEGAGTVLSIGDLIDEAGTNIQMQQVLLGPVTPEVELLLKGYDPRLAPVDIHLAIFDPDTSALISLTRKFRGTIDSMPVRRAAIGGQSVLDMRVASSARSGTRTLALKKSDESQRRRSEDRFARYADISAKTTVWWGEVRS